jgi:hypothetical protein
MADPTVPRSAPAGTTSDDEPRPGRVALLAVGDLVVFLVFVVLGLTNHKEAVTAGNIARTAAPFVIAWAVIGSIFGAYGRRGSAASTQPRVLLARSIPAWVVAWSAGLVLRVVVFRDTLAPAFVIIALVFNAIFLLGWRVALAQLTWRPSRS